jgi:hypothetical protein
MAAEYFNSLGGFSVGIPAVAVVDGNGNVISNFNNLSGNVSANKVYASNYYFANGQPFNANPGGTNTQLQYNNSGSFAGIPNVTYNGSILNLGNVSSLSIQGGVNGYFLQTDGSGNLTWSPAGNGTGGNGSPGGSNTQIQFNDSGNFNGSAGFTFNKNSNVLSVPGNVNAGGGVVAVGNVQAAYFQGNGSQLTGISVEVANTVRNAAQPNITSVGTLTSISVSGNSNLGAVGNVKILGGIDGYVLTTDGTGNLTWEAGGGGGGGTPGGSNTQIQFNSSGNFAGSSAFTFNSVSNVVTMTGNLTTRNITANNATFYGNINSNGNITANFFVGDGTYISNIQTESANLANYVVQPNQSNITSVGTLTSLSVTGNVISSQTISGAQLQTSGNANVGTLRTTSGASITGPLSAIGNINFTSSPNVSLGSVANIKITGGLNGYVLTTDGLGTLSWQPSGGGGGGNGTPGGSDTQVQYNDLGNFGGSSFFTFNENTNTVQVSGKLIANSMQLGSGAYKFGSSAVYFATTATTAKQVLYSIPVTECSGVDFEIIGTDSAGLQRQFVKISSLYYAGIVTYNEYASLYINGGVGNFEVDYNPGDVINPPSLDLAVTPDSANNTVYKMLVMVLAP